MFPTLSFGSDEIAPQEMALRAARAAGALAAAGIKDGDTFAIMMRNEPALIDVMLAARQIGAYFVPLNWHFKADEAGFILRDSGAKALVIHRNLLGPVESGVPDAMPVFAVAPDPANAGGDASAGPSRATIDWHDMLARAHPLATASTSVRGMVPYTSGTTGQPKGVRRFSPAPDDAAAAAQRLAHMYRTALGVVPHGRHLISAPLYHSAPTSYVLFASLCGAWLRIEPRFDAEATLAAIERHRITRAYLVPTMLVRLLRLSPDVRRRYDLSSLEFVVTTGAPCAPDVKQAMIDWFGDILHETYAASELGYMTTISSREARERPGSAGRPIEGVDIAILDDKDREVPPGTIGTIYLKRVLAPPFTYINRQKDRDAIEHNGMLTVGDIGYVDAAGYLYMTDRRNDLVLSGGVNIYPAEIEAQLITMLGVADCAVFGVPDAEFGQSLVAVIQPADGAALDPAHVQAFLATRLANFKIPRRIDFRATLPREDTGKIFKRKLRDEYTAATKV